MAVALADGTAQTLPFTQNWSNTGLITANDNWSGVPGIVGYLGDDASTTASGADPQTILTDVSVTQDVIANQTNPNTSTAGGVAEFEIADPTIALQGSGTADYPNIVINLNTTGQSGINVAYNLRDIDGSADNAVQPVALQYRVGSSGNYTNVPAGFVADATTGPSLATLVTAISATLPAAADNQALVQVRIITANAAGSDEWVGIDDINIASGTGDAAPSVASTTPESGATNVAANSDITINFSEAVSVNDNWYTISCSASGSHTATTSGGPTSYVLNPDTDFAGNETCTVTIVAGQVADVDSIDPPDTLAADYVFSFTTVAAASACGDSFTPIYDVQGNGNTSPLANTAVTIEGVVTGDFQGSASLNGFFIQDPTGDGNAATSDGIFVSSNTAVQVGERVRVSGTAAESFGQTVINNATQVTICGPATPITPTQVDLPLAATSDYERYEGMLVTFPETLTVTDVESLDNFGELTVSADGRLYIPTNGQPGTEDNAVNRLIVDDERDGPPTTVPYLNAQNTRRVGDTVTSLTGVLSFGFSNYRLRPTAAPQFVDANPRTVAPESVGGTVRVASFNVLNYFTTIDTGSNNDRNDATGDDARGADSDAEFVRQRDKIIAAIKAIDADVVGLIEIENNGTVAIDNLVAGLNAAYGTETYASIVGPSPGTDAIMVAFIYKPLRVTPVGSAINNTDPVHNRAPLAQTFQNSNGDKFTAVVNHFKSKNCGGARGDDTDQGQGCFNATRVRQAEALVAFVNSLKTSSGDEDVLVIGDLNAYGEEDPIDTLEAGGLINEVEKNVPLESRYSYVFDAQSGYLDHALATGSLDTQVSDVTVWHINADEPDVLDYNTEFKPTPDLYAPTPYRSSDHDPVVIGLNLTTPNAAPVADSQTVNTDEDTPVAITLTATDADGDSLTYSVVTQPTNGTLSGTAPDLTYTPNANFNGTDTFTYTVSDGNNGVATATVIINVISVNDPPDAVDDSVTTLKRWPVIISVLNNDSDPDGDSLAVLSVTQGTSGLVVFRANLVIYIPGEKFKDTDTFTYTITDGRGGTDTATVTVQVIKRHPNGLVVGNTEGRPK